jgi:hypothetical protein
VNRRLPKYRRGCEPSAPPGAEHPAVRSPAGTVPRCDGATVGGATVGHLPDHRRGGKRSGEPFLRKMRGYAQGYAETARQPRDEPMGDGALSVFGHCNAQNIDILCTVI